MDSQHSNTPKFSIVIPTWKHLQDCLIPCIESIKKFTDLSETECIIVANGCGSDGTREYVESLGEPFRLVWIDEQNGYTKSVNAGIREAQGDFLILLNNDCILLDQPFNDWIRLLSEPFSDPTVGLTGPVKVYCPHAQREFLIFCCAMIRRAALEQLGGELDETFSPGGGEDTSICCEAEDAGWKVVRVPESSPLQLADKGDPSLPAYQQQIWVTAFPLYHLGGASFGTDDFDGYQKILERNAAELRRRYVVNISRAQQIEGWMADSELGWLARQAKKAGVFVELGSWQGRSTRALADNLPVGSVIYACDTFCGSSGEPDAHLTAKEREGDAVYMKFFGNLYDHIMLGRVIPVRMESGNAAETLMKMGVRADCLFVDADHSYDGVKRDIELWRPLVKDGGILCGHDYYLPEQNPLAWVGVRTCVDELFPEATQAPNTTIWQVKIDSPWNMLRRSIPVTESLGEYGGFFAPRTEAVC